MNTVQIKKALRDLLLYPAKSLLLVLALFIGIVGFGAVFVSYSILTKDLNGNYQTTTPVHAVITFNAPVNDARLNSSASFSAFLKDGYADNGKIESLEFRDYATLRIEVHKGDWIPLWLYGVEDFSNMRIAKMFSESGAPRPQKGSMLVERNGLLISDIAMGSAAKVRADERILHLPVAGIAFDPGRAPANQDKFIYAYVDQDTFQELAGAPKNQRLLVRFKDVHTKEDVTKSIAPLLAFLGEHGLTTSSVEIPKFNEHPHQWQLNTLMLIISSIGLLAFFLSAVLISQLMKAVLASQVRQIGIMKAIGGNQRQVMQIYGAMVVTLATVAAIPGIPLAITIGRNYSAFVAGILNFNILTVQLPVYTYLVLFCVAFGFPILFSLPSIKKGVNAPVKDALHDYSIDGGRGPERNRSRYLLTVLSMAIGIGIFSTAFNVQQSLINLLDSVDKSLKYDVQVVLKTPVTAEKAMDVFRKVEGYSYLEYWNGGTGAIETNAVSTDTKIGIIAVPENTDLLALKMVKGNWIRKETDIVINQQALESLGNPAVGDRVVLQISNKSVPFTLAGVAETFDVAKIYMDYDYYNQLANPEHRIGSFMFTAKDNSYKGILALKANIENALETSDFTILYVMSQKERLQIIYDHLYIILSTLILLGLLMLVVSAIGMASAIGISIMERSKEIGIMKAIGANSKQIVSRFMKEGFRVVAQSIILGLLIAQPLSYWAAGFFGNLILGEGSSLRYAFSLKGLLITLAATLVFGYFASRLPAKQAARVTTKEALAYE